MSETATKRVIRRYLSSLLGKNGAQLTVENLESYVLTYYNYRVSGNNIISDSWLPYNKIDHK